jgi:L-fuculose-phosphate aldolase
MREEYPSDERPLRLEIARIGRMLYERGLIVAGDGNISARLSDGMIVATPAGACKGMLDPDDMVVVDLEGQPRSPGQRRVSSEILLHLAYYRARADVLAVVHAHPPTAVAATLAGVRLDDCVLPEVIIALGAVPTAPYAMTGTAEVPASIAPYAPDHNGIMLSHHGAVTVGDTLLMAFWRMEQIEHTAKILLAAHQFGGALRLPPERIAQLDALRVRLGGHPDGGCKG